MECSKLGPIVEIKRFCFPDKCRFKKDTNVLEPLVQKDSFGMKEIILVREEARLKLRSCSSDSAELIFCCSLCDRSNWIFQGSQYQPEPSLEYADANGCVPYNKLLNRAKFIVP